MKYSPIQGTHGDCYFLSAAAAVASVRPDLIKKLFVTQEINKEGFYEVKLYIRGKLWKI